MKMAIEFLKSVYIFVHIMTNICNLLLCIQPTLCTAHINWWKTYFLCQKTCERVTKPSKIPCFRIWDVNACCAASFDITFVRIPSM